MKRWILTALMITLSSCMKIKAKDDGTSESSPVAVQGPARVNVSYPSEGPNKYQVKFEFLSAPNAVLVVKTIKGVKTSEWIQLQNQTWIDPKSEPGDQAHYEFGTLTQNHFDLWNAVDAKIPQDLVIDKNLDVTDQSVRQLLAIEEEEKPEEFSKNASSKTIEIKQFKKIYFSSHGVLSLNGKSLRLEVEEIHSENGLIQTFDTKAQAEKGIAGRDGGTLQIKALRATGNLTIQMRGENGGDGVLAKFPDAALKGATGFQGEAGELGYRSLGEFSTYHVSCKKAPGRGLRGEKGLSGYAGGDGQKGGNTGSASVDILESKDFSILITPTVGDGGKGALGGEGGSGGDGGPSGAIPPVGPAEVCDCPQLPGNPGPQGDRGLEGHGGQSGQIQSFLFNQKPAR